ncbi:phasin family protein [Bradyrhizobium pachyrhizi]|uniref:phasin family protein n=1 Tax=Bradyrhizobium pachyrhizi TaxID=280333 RepID=UPI0024B14DF6|nr:phasin family protein [Bradyrhizobium pachyrhizi]WFU60032.1 phasin family protein [Bradyrhizobium pachyrhizi]
MAEICNLIDIKPRSDLAMGPDQSETPRKSGKGNPNADRQSDETAQQRRKSGQQEGPPPDQLQHTPKEIGAQFASTDTSSTDTSSNGRIVSAETTPVSYQEIAKTYADYVKKSFEHTKSFFEKLAGARSFYEALELQTDFLKQTHETLIAGSQKIHRLHGELAKQTIMRLQGLGPKTNLPRSTDVRTGQ